MVKENLKRWNQDDFGNIDSQIHKLETAIQEFDDKSNQRLNLKNWKQKKKRKQIFGFGWNEKSYIGLKIPEFPGSSMEIAAQNSFMQWLRSKEEQNSLASIEVNGSTIDDPSKIKEGAKYFFKEIFTEECSNRPIFEGLDFNCLSQEQASSLT